MDSFVDGSGYLAACTAGLPTLGTLAAQRADLDAWSRAETSPATYGALVEEGRALFAGIVGVDPDRVATGSQTSAIVAVVDPGVGSARRAIAARAGSHWVFGPDNGLLAGVLARTPPEEPIVEITDPRYMRPVVSRTFEGRDRFAPAAAWLAKGTQLTALGRTLPDFHRVDIPLPDTTDPTTLGGMVLLVDRFGNLVTNIDRRTFEVFAKHAEFRIVAGGVPVGRLVSTYAEIGVGEVCALFGSSDHLELAANATSAAQALGLTKGAAVEIKR